MLDRAKRLAAHHLRRDPATQQIFYSPHPTELRFVEVTPSVYGEAEPVDIYPLPSYEGCRVYCALLSPWEWQVFETGALKMPPDWEELIKL